MAKKIYVGVDNEARKVKAGFIGDEYGIARRIKKAYIGIGGIARPCFTTGLEYYGTTTEGLLYVYNNSPSKSKVSVS